MKNKNILIGVGICVLVAVVGFWGGYSYSKGKNQLNSNSFKQGQFSQNRFDQNGGGRMMGVNNNRGMMGGGFTTGEVISKDDKSMTIKLRDGGSKIILLSQTSKVEKTVDGSTSDVVVGKSVMVTGTTNPDGSVSATSIQIRPTVEAPVQNKIN